MTFVVATLRLRNIHYLYTNPYFDNQFGDFHVSQSSPKIFRPFSMGKGGRELEGFLKIRFKSVKLYGFQTINSGVVKKV